MMQRVTAVVGLLALAGGAWGAGQQQFVVTEFAAAPMTNFIGGLTIDVAGDVWGVESFVSNGEEVFRLFSFSPGAGVVHQPLMMSGIMPMQVAVNDHGQVMFDAINYGEGSREARRYDLGANDWTLATPGTESAGFDLNDLGDAAGWVATEDGFEAAIIRADGGIERFGTLGGSHSHATAINAGGVIVGSSLTGALHNGMGLERAFVSAGGGLTDLGTLGGLTSHALDINSAGVVVGQADFDELRSTAFIYTADTGMQSLGVMADQTWGGAHAINDLGWVVGMLASSGDRLSFVWSEETGLVDVGTLLTGESGLEDVVLLDINDAGQIAVIVDIDGYTHLARITVALVPAPAGAALAGLALLVGARRRRH